MAQESRVPLTLKYRPGFFRDVVGQEAISSALSNAISLGRVHPAYLFHGPRGSGKTSMARIYARALNCSSRHSVNSSSAQHLFSLEPCGSCSSCQEIAEGRSIDVLEIDAASHTQVDHIREVVLDTVALAPSKGKYRIFIIDEVHMLSTASFNAMLKTLEEPPGHVVFILATTELNKVPATVVSRTQSFPFRAFSRSEIIGRLTLITETEKLAVSQEAIAAVALAAGGSLRDAVSIFEQLVNLSQSGREVVKEDLNKLLGFVAQEAINDLLKRLVQEPDFNQSRELLSEILYRQGHSPSQVMGGLLRQASQVMIEALSNREEILARSLYRFIEHASKIQSLMKFSSDPVLVCETGILGFFAIREDSSTGQVLIQKPAAPNPSSKPIISPNKEERSSHVSLAQTKKNESVAKEPPKTPVKNAKETSSVQVVSKKTEEAPVNNQAAINQVPSTPVSTVPPALAAAPIENLTSSQIFVRMKESLVSQGLGVYLTDAYLKDALDLSSARELLVANEFCLQGLEKNKEKFLRAWKTSGAMGSLPALRVMTQDELKAAVSQSSDLSSAGPSAATDSSEIPDEIKQMAKEFGGKIKRRKA